ncbi:MAG TPA: glycosyltransferase family 4 protein [Solirubrobacteraceae bacterium]|jgi:glycosyltransferase involved in cell wall biosynthesis|nr:glycosyltransferase family 4 protein [Solirubrobacteraceae bacterium]
MRVAFLVNDLQLSGGVGVVAQHARRLAAMDGWEVTLVLAREQDQPTWESFEQLRPVRLRAREEALKEQYDVAVATWWETVFTLFELRAERYAYFVQSFEDRFYKHDEAERLGAALTHDLPVSFITEAGWIARTLGELRPDASCHLVRNGIDKAVFGPAREPPANDSGPLRVLIEGSPSAWFKHVREATEAAAAMSEQRHVTVVTGEREALGEVVADEVVGPLTHPEIAELYGRSDVLLKLSSVEGMFGPPLEAFHRGATCVVTPVTGYDEYVEHGWNGLLTDWEDLRGTARQLDLLARDRALLAFLRTNALETARAWPSWDQASQFMAGALQAILREPAPGGAAAAGRMLADLRGGLEDYHLHLRERAVNAYRLQRIQARVRGVLSLWPVRRLLALRRFRAVQIAARPARPVTSRVRRLLK